MTIEWFGDRAVQVPLRDPAERRRAVAALQAALPTCQVRAGMEVVLVESARPDAGLLDAVRAVEMAPEEGSEVQGRSVTIEVRYDGVDLTECASLLDLSAEGLVRAHQAQHWQVAMMGFAPGFGYLVPAGEQVLDWRAVHRRPTPRTQVPAGSVAIAAGMSAVYPNALPGGWQLIGTTQQRLFDAADTMSPTLLSAGDIVVFRTTR